VACFWNNDDLVAIQLEFGAIDRINIILPVFLVPASKNHMLRLVVDEQVNFQRSTSTKLELPEVLPSTETTYIALSTDST
jgi:hypothetical protein